MTNQKNLDTNAIGVRKARYLDDNIPMEELLSDCELILLGYQWDCELDCGTLLWMLDRMMYEVRSMLLSTETEQHKVGVTDSQKKECCAYCEIILSLLSERLSKYDDFDFDR